MRNPANTRAMRFISFALVIAMVMCGISGIFSVANAEGETFTVDQVATMAKEVYEAGKESGFAETATIGSTTMDQPTYFILACKALLNIDNGATIANSTGADIALVNTAMAYRANPGNGDDSIPSSAENFTKAEYIYCAERQVAYTQGKVVEGTSGAPANYTTMPGSCPGSQLAGKAGYARQLTLVLAALASYKDNGTLPETIPAAYNAKAEFVPADPNATPVPTAGPSLGNFAMSAVVEAAAAIDLTAALPETVTVAGTSMNQPSFYNLMAQTIVNIDAGTTAEVTTLSLVAPTAGDADSLTDADGNQVSEIAKAAYVNRASRDLGWITNNGAPSNFATYNNGEGNDNGVTGYMGRFSYLRAFTVMARALAAYKTSNALPETVDASYFVPVATPDPTKAPSGTVTVTEVLTAATNAYAEFLKNGAMPTTVKVGANDYNGASFFRMMADVIYNTLGEGREGDIPVYILPEPESDAELGDGFKDQPTISKGAYLYAAQRQLIYIDALDKDGTPAKVVSFPGSYVGDEGYTGQLTYSRINVVFARVLDQYVTTGSLPENVDASKAVSKSITVDEVVAAVPAFLEAYNKDNTILTTLTVAGSEANRGQYYKLFVEAINNINNGDTSAACTFDGKVAPPDGNGQDTFVADENDEISKAGYLFAVKKGIDYLATSTVPAKYVTYSEESYTDGDEGYTGMLTYQNQLVIYARVLEYYAQNKTLPEKVSAEFTLPTSAITVDFTTALDAVITADTYFKNNSSAIAPNVKLTISESEEYTLGQASYLKLAALLIKAINEGKTNESITFTTTYNPENPAGNDAFSSETISKAGYLFVVESQLAFMANEEVSKGRPANYTAFGGEDADGNAVESGYTGTEGYTGNFSMNRASVVLPRVLAAYKAEGKLPESVSTVYKAVEGSSDTLELVAGSTYALAEGLLTGVAAKTTVADVIAQFKGSVQVADSKGVKVEDTKNAGTGMQVQLLKADGSVAASVVIVISGDTTGDGIVNSRDIAAIQKVVSGASTFEAAFSKAADLRADGTVNSRDIAAVQKIVAGV